MEQPFSEPDYPKIFVFFRAAAGWLAMQQQKGGGHGVVWTTARGSGLDQLVKSNKVLLSAPLATAADGKTRCR